jgi:hypothetical protein
MRTARFAWTKQVIRLRLSAIVSTPGNAGDGSKCDGLPGKGIRLSPDSKPQQFF